MLNKSILLSIIICLLFSSCKGITDMRFDRIFKEDLKGHSIYYGNFNTVHDPYDLKSWFWSNMEYRITDERDFHYTVKEVIDRRYGDCAVYALIAQNILFVQCGIKAGLAFVNTVEDNSRTIVSGGDPNHVVLLMPDGTLRDPQHYSIYHGSIMYTYTFEEVYDI